MLPVKLTLYVLVYTLPPVDPNSHSDGGRREIIYWGSNDANEAAGYLEAFNITTTLKVNGKHAIGRDRLDRMILRIR